MDEPIHPLHLEALRGMTPEQKLGRVAELYEEALRRLAAYLHLIHPDWPTERLEREARRSLLYSGA
ncbi:MAG: hypothetical protein ACT4P3_14220 [Betaproteobacteria bacterium]